jgi:hypothetical protein
MPRTLIPNPVRRIPDQERELPVGRLSEGGEWVSLSRAWEEPEIGSSLLSRAEESALSDDYSRQLAIERIRARKDFRVGVLGGPVLTQKSAIDEIDRRTEVGEQLVRAEIGITRRYLRAAKELEAALDLKADRELGRA